jgi:carboxypeptidase Taq
MLTAQYDRLVATLRHHADLAAALRLLEWDQETFMPAGVIDARARQIGTLAALHHGHETAPEFLDLIDELAGRLGELTPEQAVDVRETKWRMDRVRALDGELVRERATLHAQARAAWITAREQDDFPALAPFLERVVEVERRVATSIDAQRDAYDVLLEEYEPGMSTAALAEIFTELRAGLLPLVDRLRVRLSRRPMDTSALCGHFPLDAQRRFNQLVAERLGFDFRRGRLDEAVHPFTTSIGEDVRLTTRFADGDLRYALYSTVHETGHGLYEQGLDRAAWGTPRGQACSLGMHESQSRLWENLVGRTRAFWEYLLPMARPFFAALGGTSLDAVFLAANEARPSLIRTEADELTYNLHIILRFELERDLVHGTLRVAELPEAWRAEMRRALGVVPATDREGVLQDVHWPSGAIGYFPTYTLGNVYASQLIAAAARDLGRLDEVLRAGAFDTLLGWLRTHVHQLGQTHRAPTLVARAAGEPPTCQPLLDHLREKVDLLESV